MLKIEAIEEISAKTDDPPASRFVIRTKLRSVEERFRQHHVGGTGKDAIFESESMGWYTTIGPISIHLGAKRPALRSGQMAKIIIEGIDE